MLHEIIEIKILLSKSVTCNWIIQKTNCKADRTAKKGNNFIAQYFGETKLTFITAPDEGEFCLTEILGNKIITLLSCPISLAIGFLFYSTLLILIYTKIRLHLATVCLSGPCIELPNWIIV